MRKILGYILLLFLGSSSCLAQFTTVTTTVVDASSTTWANAPYSWSFQPGPNQSNPANYTYNGAALASYSGSGAANGSGVITVSGAIYDVTLISPIGASYNFTVCPNASSKCSTINFKPSGGSVDISAAVNAAIFTPSFNAIAGAYGYNDAEALASLLPGSTYWNVTSSTSRCYTGGAWGLCSSSGSGTITGVTAGTGLNGGGTSGTVTLNLNTALPFNETATTQAPGDNSTKVATTAYVNRASSPGGASTNEQYNNAGTLGGTTTIYLSPSGDTTGAADPTAIAAAVATGGKVHLGTGVYYWNTGLTLSSSGCDIEGEAGTVIEQTTGTLQYFNITYQVAGGSNPITTRCILHGFALIPKNGVTPTAGGGIKVGSASGAGFYTIGLHVENVTMNNLWGGLNIGAGQISNWFQSVYCNTMTSGGQGCIYYNSPAPSGDDHFNDIEANGANTGLTITQSDTTEYSNLKLNGSEVLFTQIGTTVRVRFIDASIEGSSQACGIDFGTGSFSPTQVSFVGGGIGIGITNAFCNKANATNFSYATNIYSTSDSLLGPQQSGYFYAPNQQLIGENTASLLGSHNGIEATGPTVVEHLISTTNGTFAYFGMNGNDSGGTQRKSYQDFEPTTSTATTCWKMYPDNTTGYMASCADGHEAFGSSGQTTIDSTGNIATITQAANNNSTKAATTAYVDRVAPVSAAVSSATGGTGTGTVTCLTAACTNVSGTYSVVGGTFTTGNLLVLVWPTTTIAYNCWTSQNGGAALYGIGHSVAAATGMTITSGISVIGITVTIDYGCSKY